MLGAEVDGKKSGAEHLQEDVHGRVVVLQDNVLTHRRESVLLQHTGESCSISSA